VFYLGSAIAVSKPKYRRAAKTSFNEWNGEADRTMSALISDLTPLSERLAKEDNFNSELLRFLLNPKSFGPGVEAVTLVESHMSLVFLTDHRAYKAKKPIANAIDLRSLEARRANCEREIALNRVLSPDIYLGLETVTRDRDGWLHLGGSGETVEWLVVMRRLDEARLLDHAIASKTVARGNIEELIDVLGPFYAQPLDRGPARGEILVGWSQMLERTAQSLRKAEYGLTQDRVEPILSALAHFLVTHENLIVARIDAGWIRDCHGDLRPQHVYLGPPLRLIDRLEFDERLRLRDPFEEIMDLGLECARLGADWIFPLLLDGLSTALGSRPDPRLLGFYGGMRASLRARFAIEHIGGARGTARQWRDRAEACLEIAGKWACAQS
jgi:aminoglycoside phosphotransferase family enzyme